MEWQGRGEREGEEEEEEEEKEEAIEGKQGEGGARLGQATVMACRIAGQMCLRGSGMLLPDFSPYLRSSTKDICGHDSGKRGEARAPFGFHSLPPLVDQGHMWA